MPRGKEISENVRELIIKFRNEGKSLSEIANIVDIGRSTIQKIIERNNDRGHSKNLQRSGRPLVTTATERRKIIREVHKNPRTSAVKIAEQCKIDSGKNISASTVRRILNNDGLHGRVARKKPCISATNKIKRKNFAKQHLNSPDSFWNNVLFSDESKFEIFPTKKRGKVWRTVNTELEPQNISSTVKHGGGSVMVWGCMSAAGTGKLVFVESTMNSRDYLSILKENLVSSAQQLGLTTPWVFQQDNDPKHTAFIVKEWLLYNVPKQLNSPPKSPDLNPIEHLWDILDKKIRQRTISCKEDLRKALMEEWVQISPTVTANLVTSMPRRLQAVISSKGGPTRY